MGAGEIGQCDEDTGKEQDSFHWNVFVMKK
jgi:hypothetical protein